MEDKRSTGTYTWNAQLPGFISFYLCKKAKTVISLLPPDMGCLSVRQIISNWLYYLIHLSSNVPRLCKNLSYLHDEDIFHETSCYRPILTLATFDEAKQNCTDMFEGGHLVTMLHEWVSQLDLYCCSSIIFSNRKNNLISASSRGENSLLSAYYETVGDKSWIGLVEVVNDGGSVQFEWIDGTTLSFDSWGLFEPGRT